MSRVRVPVLVAVGVLLGLSCKSEPTEPPVPTTFTPSQTALSFDALTATAPLTATVLDQDGQTMNGLTISWTSNTPTVATVDDSGIVTAVGNGTATIRGSVGGAAANVTVTVQQVVTTLEKGTGDEQTGTVATPLLIPIAVIGKDRLGGNLTAGATGQVVTFTVTGGGGSVSTATAAFSSAGQAATTWTLGSAPGVNTLSASTPAGSIDFTATGALGPPSAVSKVAGDAQTAEVGTAVTTAPRVRVADVGGNALEGVAVTFVVTDGLDGSVTGADVQTDAGGFAQIGSWTLATTAGDNTLEAQVGALAAVFGATGMPGPASDLSIFEGNNQSAVVDGAVTIPPAVLVADQHGNGVAGEMVDFTVTLGGGSVTGTPATSDADGVARVGSWTLGSTPGPNTLDATLGGVGSVTFSATAVPPFPDSVDVHEGDNQTGLVGFAVNVPPAVIVLNTAGDPFQGATVIFAVASGGGTVSGETVVTGADGVARVGSWTLGGSTGTNTLTATVQSTMPVTDNPVTFTATGVTSQYNVEVRFIEGTTPTAAQQAAFDAAEAFWEQAIISEHLDLNLTLTANQCGSTIPHPAVSETVDDVLILVRFDAIDGPSNTVARAGWCVRRTSPDVIPAFGLMQFDTDDLPGMESSGRLTAVVMHEMGHVLGFGQALWNTLGFLENPSLSGGNGVDTHFDGPRAIDTFDAIGGTSYTGGAKVPVENTAVSGSADSHWRENVFDEELMTPIIENTGPNPLSRLSIAAMWDLGYTVNLASGEPYTQIFSAPPALGASSGGLHLVNDQLDGPQFVIDSTGRIRPVVPRR